MSAILSSVRERTKRPLVVWLGCHSGVAADQKATDEYLMGDRRPWRTRRPVGAQLTYSFVGFSCTRPQLCMPVRETRHDTQADGEKREELHLLIKPPSRLLLPPLSTWITHEPPRTSSHHVHNPTYHVCLFCAIWFTAAAASCGSYILPLSHLPSPRTQTS